jgi:hypothetical protein
MTIRSKILIALLAAVAVIVAVFVFRDAPLPPPPVAAQSAEIPATPQAASQPPPMAEAPRGESRPRAESSDPYEFIRALARSAYEGDGRAQFLVARELDRCYMTLSLIRK